MSIMAGSATVCRGHCVRIEFEPSEFGTLRRRRAESVYAHLMV
jgi:hypothetical protein